MGNVYHIHDHLFDKTIATLPLMACLLLVLTFGVIEVKLKCEVHLFTCLLFIFWEICFWFQNTLVADHSKTKGDYSLINLIEMSANLVFSMECCCIAEGPQLDLSCRHSKKDTYMHFVKSFHDEEAEEHKLIFLNC